MADHERNPREFQPDFDVEEREAAAGPDRKLAKGGAARILRELHIVEPPIDIEDVIAGRGLTIKKAEVPGNLSGRLYPDLSEVFINTMSRAVVRQRFTMGHELGHWELGHHKRGIALVDFVGFDGPYGDPERSEPTDPVEVEANAFAAEILMPSQWIRRLPKGLAG